MRSRVAQAVANGSLAQDKRPYSQQMNRDTRRLSAMWLALGTGG
jgi:hypothetical protein